MRKILERWAARLAHDSGVVGLIIAMIIAIVSATALTVYFKAYGPGAGRTLKQLQETARAGEAARDAVMAYIAQQATVPCPDTGFDGDADTCPSSNTGRGRLPWRTLGLSKEDAVDPYGRYYDYVVTGVSAERSFCLSVDNDFGGSPEYTGEMTPSATLEVRTTTATAGTFVPFVIMSHGSNGYGGIPGDGTTAIAGASGFESTNATSSSNIVYSGPQSTSSSAPFDDTVYAPTQSKLQKTCEMLSPGGQKNAQLADGFNNGTTFSTAKWSTPGGSTPPTQANGLANFTASGGYLATATSVEVSPGVRPIYISAYWTPMSATNTFAIVTRATAASTTTDGVTFTFGASNDITNDDGPASGDGVGATAASITITAGRKYLLEVFDNGDDVWSRITQVDGTSSPPTATVRATGVADDFGGSNQVVFQSGTASSTTPNYIDDVAVSYPMMSFQTNSTSNYGSAGSANGSSSGSLTLETWVRPASFPSGQASIISQWDTGSNTNSSFRLYLSGGSALMFDVNDSASNDQSVSLGIELAVNTWSHIAVTYDSTNHRVTAYKDGVFVSSTTTTLTAGLHSNSESIGFGRDSVSTPANAFSGQISDVRIWDFVRTSSQIATCFQRRLGGSSPCDTPTAGAVGTRIVANWWMDPVVQDNPFTLETMEAAVGSNGTANAPGADYYTPALALYYRATSFDLCPSNQAGAYRCDYRSTVSASPLTVPARIQSTYVKAWGGGGGGYQGVAIINDQAGGGGGYAGGLLSNTGVALQITVGAGGAAGALVTASDGSDTFVKRATGPTLIEGQGGDGGRLTGAGDQGNSTAHSSVDFGVEATSINDEDGPACVPSGDPCTDPYYGSLTNGRGGAAGLNAGQVGLVILLW